LVCGIYVEKGLGSEARPAYRTAKAKSHFMDSNWRWESFVAALASGKFADDVAGLERNQSANWEIRIDCGFVPDKDEFDPQSSGYHDAWAWYRWSWEPRTNMLQPLTVDDPQHISPSLRKAASFTDLATMLTRIPRDPWLWIDVMIGLPLLKNSDSTTTDFRSAQQLWNWHLRPLASWLGAAD
jgi:hypothetical protein